MSLKLVPFFGALAVVHAVHCASALPALAEAPPEVRGWSPEDPAPAGYHTVKRRRFGLLIGGAITFAVGYAMAAGGGAGMLREGDSRGTYAYIPVGGPFAAMGAHCTLNDCGAGISSPEVMAMLGGVHQVVGATLLLVGMSHHVTRLEPNDAEFSLRPTPVFGPRWAGWGVSGTF